MKVDLQLTTQKLVQNALLDCARFCSTSFGVDEKCWNSQITINTSLGVVETFVLSNFKNPKITPNSPLSLEKAKRNRDLWRHGWVTFHQILGIFTRKNYPGQRSLKNYKRSASLATFWLWEMTISHQKSMCDKVDHSQASWCIHTLAQAFSFIMLHFLYCFLAHQSRGALLAFSCIKIILAFDLFVLSSCLFICACWSLSLACISLLDRGLNKFVSTWTLVYALVDGTLKSNQRWSEWCGCMCDRIWGRL